MNVYSFNKGNQAFKEKDYRKAIEFFKAALDENPAFDFIACNHMIGYCYYFLNEYDNALKELIYTTKHANTDLERLYLFIGNIYKKKRDFNNAVINYKKSLEQNSENVNCLFWLSESLYEINNFDEALKTINTVLENKKTGEPYLLKGKICEKLNQNTTALICYNKMIQLNENDLTAYQAMGNNLFDSKDFTTARKYFTICLRMIPHGIFFYKRGICEKNIGNLDNYKADIQKSAEMNFEPAKNEIKQNAEIFITEKKLLLFFDTETTGLPKDWKAPISKLDNWPRLVQIAWKVYDNNGKLIESKSDIIKPENFEIPHEASQVHGITTSLANDIGKDLNEVLESFMHYVKQSNTIIAHNLSFDEKVIASELYRLNILNPFKNKERICTMEKSTNICKIEGNFGYKWPKLQELHQYLFGEEFEEAHNAEIDIKATADCFWELRRRKLI
ncbi:MAG: exonuclease domain-containing protein [Flavobacterium sp.]